jgi:hypothetical protein
MLTLSLAVSFRFLPKNEAAAGAQKAAWTLHDTARGVDLFVSYYEGGGNDVVLFSPPLSMPLSAVEELCFALKDMGYKVLAFTRPHFDSFAVNKDGETIELAFSQKLARYAQTAWGIKSIPMVNRQRQAAAEREADARFLLYSLKKDAPLREAVPYYENLFLLGYGAGGAAFVALSGDQGFLQINPEIKAAAAIESIVLCDFAVDDSFNEDDSGGFIAALVYKAEHLFDKPVRLEHIPHPLIPVLFAAGEDAEGKNRYDRYAAVIQTMLESESPFLFASFNGVHAVDFSSFLRQYPVMALFFKGKKESPYPRNNTMANAAGYIAAFFAQVKEDPSFSALTDRLAVPGLVSLETLK